MYSTPWQMIDGNPRRCAALSSDALSQILTRIVRDGDNLGVAPLACLEAECDFRKCLNLSAAELAADYMEEFHAICAEMKNSDAYKRNYGNVYDEYMTWRRRIWNEADGFIPLASREEDEGMLIPFNLGDYPGNADAIFGKSMRKCRECLQKLHFPEYGVVIDQDLLPEKIEDGGSFGLPLALAFSHICVFPHSGDDSDEQSVKHPLFIATGELSLDDWGEVVFKAVGGINPKKTAAVAIGASFVCADIGVRKITCHKETRSIIIPDNTIFVQGWTYILNNLNYSAQWLNGSDDALATMPVDHPPLLNGFHYEIIDNNAILSWKSVSGYTVKVFSSRTPIAPAGKFLPETNPIFAKCEAVHDIDQAGGKGSWKIPALGLYYLTPVICKDGTARVDKAVTLVAKAAEVIPCVTNIKAIRLCGDIELSWEWPHGYDRVRVVWRNDRPPESPFDEMFGNIIVTQTTYKRDMAYIVKHVKGETYFFSIYTLSDIDGKEEYSAPNSCISIGDSECQMLSYSFSKKKKYYLYGKNIVTLNLQISNGCLPDMVLVKQFGRQPLSRQDGIVCRHLSATNDSKKSIQLSKDETEPGTYLKLFLANPKPNQLIRIIHPPYNNMKM